MALVSMRQILDHAAERGYGVPAFNINNMEQLLSVMEAADKTNSPVIVETSRGARKYAGDVMLTHMIQAVVKMYPHIPVCLHLDHGNGFETCQTAVAAGFTSVMMDGSLDQDSRPSSFEYNANITRSVVDVAHLAGVSVEGEIGVLGSLETGEGEKEDGHGVEGKVDKEKLVTDPDEAARFVEATKVDALAVACGTSHGAYKFTSKPTGETLAMDAIRKIHERLPNTHLVMHGASSVPQELQDIFNQFGGEMKQTYGVPLEEIAKGIKNGVRKVNVDTDCRMAMTGQVRRVLLEKKAEFDVRKYMVPAREAMVKVCIERYEAFGTAGNAHLIKPLTMEAMAARYKTGEMDPTIR